MARVKTKCAFMIGNCLMVRLKLVSRPDNSIKYEGTVDCLLPSNQSLNWSQMPL